MRLTTVGTGCVVGPGLEASPPGVELGNTHRHKKGGSPLVRLTTVGTGCVVGPGLEASPILSTSWKLGTKHMDKQNLYQTATSNHERV